MQPSIGDQVHSRYRARHCADAPPYWMRRLGADVILSALRDARNGDDSGVLFLTGATSAWREKLDLWCAACGLDPEAVIDKAQQTMEAGDSKRLMGAYVTRSRNRNVS